jgi:hypothetical protein
MPAVMSPPPLIFTAPSVAFGSLFRLKRLNSEAPKELKAYYDCMDYYRQVIISV